uniref:Cyclic nucleotide-binding domain-containing protein n=1 Tax=Hemiselmis tepida TaxID=464990 RepID=A0A7S0WEI7_9CRYP
MFIVIDGFVRLYSTIEPTKYGKELTLEAMVLKDGDCFEETSLVHKRNRLTTAVALASSTVGEISHSDLHTILSNPKYAAIGPAVDAVVQGWTPFVYAADALMRDAQSALFTLVDVEERNKLALGAERTEFEAGDIVQHWNQVCFSVYIVIDGELEVLEPVFPEKRKKKKADQKEDPPEPGNVICTLTKGCAIGEFCVVACAKGQSIVRAKVPTVVVDVPMEICEPLILSRPDVVDDMHDIKLIFRRRHVCIEKQAFEVKEILEIFKKESAQAAEDAKDAPKALPYFSRWSTGETMEICEISPPVFGAMPSVRGRYERSSKKLAEATFNTMYVGYDTDWCVKVAWNEVSLKKLSSTIRMQFLQEVETTLMLTNDQPTWLRYSMVEDRHGNTKMIHHWELSQARRTKEMEEGFTPRSQPMGDSQGHLGMKESEFEITLGVEGWRTLRPWVGAEKPSDWDRDSIPDRFLSEEQREEKRLRPERIFVAPNIVKCFNFWDDEETGKMVFITEIIDPGARLSKRGFTCLQLGNYTPTGHERREATGGVLL